MGRVAWEFQEQLEVLYPKTKIYDIYVRSEQIFWSVDRALWVWAFGPCPGTSPNLETVEQAPPQAWLAWLACNSEVRDVQEQARTLKHDLYKTLWVDSFVLNSFIRHPRYSMGLFRCSPLSVPENEGGPRPRHASADSAGHLTRPTNRGEAPRCFGGRDRAAHGVEEGGEGGHGLQVAWTRKKAQS